MRAAFFLCCCAVTWPLFGQPASAKNDTPYVVLVSFDGFRYDYVNRYDAPNFKSFISQGSAAEGLIPSFPSKTFPNHYSIVTGMYPGNHGLVDNSFYDPGRKVLYSMKSKDQVKDPYFYGGVPIWQLAKEHGYKSASFFWVGSELPTQHPDYFRTYDQSFPDTLRVQQVLDWLALPNTERPHFISLYFSSPDHEGHLFGPFAEETRKAVLNADALLGRLMEGLKRLSLEVNVILVSDHGMRELKQQPSTFIFLDEVMNLNDPQIRVANGGTQAHIYVKNLASRDSLYALLKSHATNYSVYTQEQFPDRWHYKTPRAGDLLITAHDGYYFQERDRASFVATLKEGKFLGVHGYDPAVVTDMRGIFYAQGPNIKRGLTIAPFENIHIYPLIARILALPLPAIDGKASVLEKIYQRRK